MSIDKTRQFLEKSGCSVIIPIGIAAVLIFGIGYNSCSKPENRLENNKEYLKSIVAKVGNHHIYTQDIEMMKQSLNRGRKNNNIIDEINILGQACQSSVIQAIMTYIAQEKKIDLSDDKILEFFEQDIKERTENMKQEFTIKGKLKANATDKEFHDAYKKETQQDLYNAIDKQRKELKEILKDKTKRDRIIPAFVPNILVKNLSKQIKVTEDEIKKQFNHITVHKIEFLKNKGKNVTQAKLALEALRNHKPIDQVRKDFGAETPKDGKGDMTLPMQIIGFIPDFAPLAKLNEGEYTDVISHGDSASIYKVIKIAPVLPPDYAKQANSYREKLITQKANEQIKKEVDEIAKSSKLEWLNQAYKTNYEYNDFVQNLNHQAQVDKETLRKKYLAFANQAENNINDIAGNVIAKGTQYLALQSAIRVSTPQQITELYKDRIKAIKNLLQYANYSGLLLELTNLYVEKKNTLSGETLVSAAKSLRDVEREGASQHEQIKQLTQKLKTEKLLSDEQSKTIEKENKRWEEELKEYEKNNKAQQNPSQPLPANPKPKPSKPTPKK